MISACRGAGSHPRSSFDVVAARKPASWLAKEEGWTDIHRCINRLSGQTQGKISELPNVFWGACPRWEQALIFRCVQDDEGSRMVLRVSASRDLTGCHG